MATKIKLDRIDVRILKTLQEQGRITNQSLADQVGLSPSPCLQRVRRLEEAGVISGYMARVDADRISARVTVLGTVTLQDHNFEDFQKFEQTVMRTPEIVECSKVSGTFDYLLRFECPTIDHYHTLSDRMLEQGQGLFRISSHVVLSHVKEFSGFPLDQLVQGE